MQRVAAFIALALFSTRFASAQVVPPPTAPAEPSSAPPAAYPPAAGEGNPAPDSSTPSEQPVAPTPPSPVSQPPAASSNQAVTVAPSVVDAPATTVQEAWSVQDSEWVLGVERVMGLQGWSMEEALSGQPKRESSGTMVNFLGSNGAIGTASDFLGPFAIPRVTLDRLLPTGLTLGGFLVYLSTSATTDEQDGGTIDWPEYSRFLVGARVGYMRQVDEQMNIWVRGGLGYFSSDDDVTESSTGASGTRSATTVLGSLEPVIVLTPVPHAGLILGANLDFTLSGEGDVEVTDPDSGTNLNAKGDFSMTGYGVSLGVALFL